MVLWDASCGCCGTTLGERDSDAIDLREQKTKWVNVGNVDEGAVERIASPKYNRTSFLWNHTLGRLENCL